MTYNLSDYNYHLPEHLIAQQLASPADSCRLMVVNEGDISHEHFYNITTHIHQGDLLIFNNSKVVPARVILSESDSVINPQGQPITTRLGETEIFFLRQYSTTQFEALVKRGKWFKPGTVVLIGDYTLHITEITDAGRMITIHHNSITGDHDDHVMNFLQQHGHIPLPPYIEDNPEKYDAYQPIVADKEGSVAAPTASLHFTNELLNQLTDQGIICSYVTLHIGIGTFRLIESDDVRDHDIHREICQISTQLFEQIAQVKNQQKHITITGTTSCRVIESLPYLYLHIRTTLSLSESARMYWDTICTNLTDPGYIIHPWVSGQYVQRETQLFMYPGFIPKIIDNLITNFHLPQSTLLLMIASLIGYEQLIKSYEIAIQKEYYFYSFGDAMLLKNLQKTPSH